MAGEQSSGTFVAGAGRDARAEGARRPPASSALDGRRRGGRARRCPAPAAPNGGRHRAGRCVTLSWPLDNLGPSLPNLLATVAGNLFELKQFSGLRLLDLRLPEAFAAAYPGPAFGIEGTRRLAGVRRAAADRHHHQAERRPRRRRRRPRWSASSREAGIDFIKDDELQADGPACPFEERARAVMRGRSTRQPTAPARR